MLEKKGARVGERLSLEDQRTAEDELVNMRKVNDQNVLHVLGFAHDVYRTLIVLELAPLGSMWDILANKDTFPVLPMTLRICWVRDLSLAIKALVEKGIRHNDIKSQNILVFDKLKLKLADFGTAHQSVTGVDSATRGIVGTNLFTAPEIRNGEKAHVSSDIFSLAVTAIQIFSRAVPRMDDVLGQIASAVRLACAEAEEANADQEADAVAQTHAQMRVGGGRGGGRGRGGSMSVSVSLSSSTTTKSASSSSDAAEKGLVHLLQGAASASPGQRISARKMVEQLTELLPAFSSSNEDGGGDPRFDPHPFVTEIERKGKELMRRTMDDAKDAWNRGGRGGGGGALRVFEVLFFNALFFFLYFQ